MHGKFSERFRSKNVVAPAPKRSHSPAKRLMAAPLDFVAEVYRSTEGRAALIVALCIYRRTHVCGSLTVTLPQSELAELGITRSCKRKALIRLQRVGLIEVENVRGRTARITLLWRE
jgi:hypothetical protein